MINEKGICESVKTPDYWSILFYVSGPNCYENWHTAKYLYIMSKLEKIRVINKGKHLNLEDSSVRERLLMLKATIEGN